MREPTAAQALLSFQGVKRLILVLSDLHIGGGHLKGEPNVYDDFREDLRFSQLLAHYTQGAFADAQVQLVLNGDIFDLLKVPVNGDFPEAITEHIANIKLGQCLQGHPGVVQALRTFLSSERNELYFQPGNHDMELFFPGVQAQLCRAVTGESVHPRFHFSAQEPAFSLDGGVQFHHGHQFEAMHAMDFAKLFLSRGKKDPILNLPWGSLFILQVLNRLIHERPYLDKVMPFWPLFVGGFFFDTKFTLRLSAASVFSFTRARLNPLWRDKRPFEKVTRLLRTELKMFSDLNHFARRLLASPATHAVFMGHTHNEMVRTHPGGKFYVNTGTWMPMVNLKVSNFGQNSALHYGLVDYDASGAPHVSLMRWHGQRPASEEVIY